MKFWEDKTGLTDADRVKKIANDPDVTAWRAVFHVISGEHPGGCSDCHTAGPFLYTPLLSRLRKGADAVAWQSIAPRLLATTRFVYPAFNGAPLQVRSPDGPAMILDSSDRIKTISENWFCSSRRTGTSSRGPCGCLARSDM